MPRGGRQVGGFRGAQRRAERLAEGPRWRAGGEAMKPWGSHGKAVLKTRDPNIDELL